MTTPNLKVRVIRRPQIKLKVLPRFPANVTASSPILLDRTGGNYAFSLDVNALRASLDPLYAPSSILSVTIVTAAGTYNVGATDSIILINKTIAAANNVQLPSSLSHNGLPLTVKDLKGDAATNNIMVLPSGAETIDGLTSVPINANYGGFKFWPLITGGWLILP